MIFKTKKHAFGGARLMTEEEKEIGRGFTENNRKKAPFNPQQQEIADRFLNSLKTDSEAQADDDYAVRVKG